VRAVKFDRVDLSEAEIAEALGRAKAALPGEYFAKIETVVRAYSTVVRLLADKKLRIDRLRRLIFGPSSEKSREVLGVREAAREIAKKPPRKPKPGHGRNGAAAYVNAKTVRVPHARLAHGDRCPDCRRGNVYEQKDCPKVLVRVTGQTPLNATLYECQKLRCGACGKVFPARPPKGVGRRKYDAGAAAMIALLKYGGGVPFNRLAKLQQGLGVPLPSSTQWDILFDAASAVSPIYEELIRQAAQGRVLHNDDTTMKILERLGRRREAARGAAADDQKLERTGVFTTGVLSFVEERRIALFFTGPRHAGENLEELLRRRDVVRPPPVQMCDALSRNLPKELKTILANCLAHGRRQFVEVAENFPEECRHVLGELAEVYKNDAVARKRGLDDAARLRFHQEHSGSRMEKLHAWMQAQFAEKNVEPNSGLGGAIGYMLKHWEALTLFLREAGAPLDNNAVERALKKAILHRKNSLFYKTDNGARVGDLYMSLIYTCELAGADPFDYLSQLQRNAKTVRAHPANWLPWNYPRDPTRPPSG
jgi:transposase